MNYTNLIVTIASLVLYAACSSADKEKVTEERPPNIILLFADDLGYGDIGAYGHPTIETPNLDQLAAEGVKLTQFYVAASICTPSRAGLLTGRLPIRTGMCGGRSVYFPDTEGGLPQEEITIAEVLKSQGYATACVGKWHLGHKPEFLPPNQGFDYYFGIPYSNDMSPVTNEWEGAQKFPPTPLIEGLETIEQEPDQSQLTRRYTEKAIDFISKNKENPFFLYLPYTFPHVPLFASDDFKGKSKRGLYGDVVQEIDWSVGQVMQTIREQGLADNTFVFFTSDNGPWLVMNEEGGSAGLLREGKGSTWEGGMREPAIAWYPGKVPAGTVATGLATSLDLLPTLAGLAGAEIPSDRTLDGTDIMQVLTNENDRVRDEVFFYRGQRLFAIRKGPWKAHFVTIEQPYSPQQQITELEVPLLFNLETDPSEKYNLASQHAEVLEQIAEVRKKHEDNLGPLVETRIR